MWIFDNVFTVSVIALAGVLIYNGIQTSRRRRIYGEEQTDEEKTQHRRTLAWVAAPIAIIGAIVMILLPDAGRAFWRKQVFSAMFVSILGFYYFLRVRQIQRQDASPEYLKLAQLELLVFIACMMGIALLQWLGSILDRPPYLFPLVVAVLAVYTAVGNPITHRKLEARQRYEQERLDEEHTLKDSNSR